MLAVLNHNKDHEDFLITSHMRAVIQGQVAGWLAALQDIINVEVSSARGLSTAA